MHTLVTVLLVWIGVSVLVGVGFSLGAAIGYRRGLEAARQEQPRASSMPVWIDVRDLQPADRSSR